MKVTALLLLMVSAALADSRFGAQTHFSQGHDQSIIPLIKDTGIGFIRDEQYWSFIEVTPGVFEYPARLTDYMAKAQAEGLEVLVTLDWGNSNYDYEGGQFTAPHTETGRAAFANYALNILQKFPQVKALEVWNEYNGGTFIAGPAASDKPLYYKLMLQKVYEAVKAVRPDVKIVAGATVTAAHGFWQDLIAQGALAYCDAVSVHYLGDIEVEIDALRSLMGANQKPIWVTEFSATYGVTPKNRDEFAAQYLAQAVARMLAKGVERMSWYLAMDDGSFPLSGLFAGPPEFKPHGAATAYSNAIKQYEGESFERRWPTSSSTFALKFSNKSVLWAEHPVEVELNTDCIVVATDMMGVTTMKTPVEGKVILPLTKDVQYVSGLFTNVREVKQDILADSATGFSGASGTNGWEYGYANLPSFAPWDVSLFQSLNWEPWGDWNYRWTLGDGYPFIDGIFTHPSDAWAIRRWVSDYAGPVRLKGNVALGGGGDGVRVRLFVDGTEKYNQVVFSGESMPFDVPVVVEAGSKVDFAVTKGGHMHFDATNFNAQVVKDSQQPIPVGAINLGELNPGTYYFTIPKQ